MDWVCLSMTGKEIGPNASHLLQRVRQNDLSFLGVGEAGEQTLDAVIESCRSVSDGMFGASQDLERAV